MKGGKNSYLKFFSIIILIVSLSIFIKISKAQDNDVCPDKDCGSGIVYGYGSTREQANTDVDTTAKDRCSSNCQNTKCGDENGLGEDGETKCSNEKINGEEGEGCEEVILTSAHGAAPCHKIWASDPEGREDPNKIGKYACHAESKGKRYCKASRSPSSQ